MNSVYVVYENKTFEKIGEVVTNHSISFDDALECMGASYLVAGESWDPDVTINGKGYWLDDLDILLEDDFNELKNKEIEALDIIYKNLNNDLAYGKDVFNVIYPFFDSVLYKSEYKDLIVWQHYGQSANKNTIRDLSWIIQVIFKMYPSEFIEKYITEDKSKIE